MRFTGPMVRCCRHLLFMSVLAGTVTLLATQAAHATQFFLDEFSVGKNGAAFFGDPFNGTAPPVAPNFAIGVPASYFVQGTFANVGNKVLMDTAAGQIVPSGITGLPLSFLQALLLTNIDPSNSVLGLKSNHTFSVTGIFDLAVPGTGEAYGIRLADYTDVNAGNDVLDLRVDHNAPDPRITFLDLDLIAHTFTVVGSVLLDPLHDQVALTLTKADANSPNVQGSFAYIDGGVMGSTNTFRNTANAFSDETFTRAAFIAFEQAAVPEASSLLLLTCGLGGFAAAAWRRHCGK